MTSCIARKDENKPTLASLREAEQDAHIDLVVERIQFGQPSWMARFAYEKARRALSEACALVSA